MEWTPCTKRIDYKKQSRALDDFYYLLTAVTDSEQQGATAGSFHAMKLFSSLRHKALVSY